MGPRKRSKSRENLHREGFQVFRKMKFVRQKRNGKKNGGRLAVRRETNFGGNEPARAAEILKFLIGGAREAEIFETEREKEN